MSRLPFGLKSLPEIARAPSWSHAQFLAGVVPAPWVGLFGIIKPRVRVKMGRLAV